MDGLGGDKPAAGGHGLFWGYYRTPAPNRDGDRNRELVAASATEIRLLDAWLLQRLFVTGERFSMADIPAGTLMFRYFGMGVTTPHAPQVAAWRTRLADRPAYREHVMRPFDELFGRLAF
jgi:glutathione S-transferase